MTAETAPSTTSTTAGARAHARAQEGTLVEAAPARPASAWPATAGVDTDRLVWAETVAGGGYTHRVLARGTTLRLTDLAGDACAHVLLFNADQPFERLNVADTVKVQWQVYAAAGQLLLSDQGRVLATVVADSSGRHDTIFGTSTAMRNTARYGDGAAQGPTPAGRELFALAGAKNGLGRRDLPPSVSYFQGVTVDDDGRPRFTGSAAAGASVTLRTEMPVIVLIANTAHPLDDRPDYASTALEVLAWTDTATTPADPLWNASPEGRRAFVNTADYLTARGLK
ncbi:urea carboxylase-associated family protein [Cryobacterium lactosi]|uniref:Urea carboxylase-associated family protein n=1 Tax=Cryobacterium lactosi TaxID=1259202 RepID=A0A4R9BTE2_9MICO|nr:urea amidolyase associated protein UAAP1 [Cryobacterium lactosi]TFD90208.1 urea carboxylase-associated family protein [Cryobacterium lactosi]